MNTEKLAIPQDAPEIDWATLDLLPYGIIVIDRQLEFYQLSCRQSPHIVVAHRHGRNMQAAAGFCMTFVMSA